MSYAFIHEHANDWPVATLCETLGVSAAGYYSWQVRAPSPRRERHDALLVAIRSAHAEAKARYGSPRQLRESTDRP